MSTLDTMTPLVSSPWLDASGRPLAIRSLPGLRAESIKALERLHPSIVRPALRELLSTCCGIADTDLSFIDFTGCCFPVEPCAVFNPCMTLAIDDAGRRWIAELGAGALPGPIWCVFPHPEVAVYVSEDLSEFLASLRNYSCRGQMLSWLQEISAAAHAVWSHRRRLALRPHNAKHQDEQIREWLSSLPSHAYVYDLRGQKSIRGWPYGVAGPSSRLYRCGRLPVFAAAGSPSEGWRSGHPRMTSPIYPVAQQAISIADAARLGIWRTPQLKVHRPLSRRVIVAARPTSPTTKCGAALPELRLCA